jgi:hypothetical protein
MRALAIAAAMAVGLASAASAQMLGPGMSMPGFNTAPQRPQEPPCFRDFAPLRAEAEKRALALKSAMEKKVPREEACTLIKRFAEAEAKVVKFVTTNAQSCGIPAEAATQMKANHGRTLKMQGQACQVAAPRPTGPGLSEALGTARSGVLDSTAPQSGALDTLTGNVLAR